MKRDVDFWFTVLARGLVALIAGSAILIVPDMAKTILLLPIAVSVAITGLAAYGIFDSALILVSSVMSETPRVRSALIIQGLLGITIGVLLLSVAFHRVQLKWFLSLAAMQALFAGIGEWVVAKHANSRSVSLWNYAACGIALVFSVVYAVLRIGAEKVLSPASLSWAVYVYLLAFGISQCMTAARMLYPHRKMLSSH